MLTESGSGSLWLCQFPFISIVYDCQTNAVLLVMRKTVQHGGSEGSVAAYRGLDLELSEVSVWSFACSCIHVHFLQVLSLYPTCQNHTYRVSYGKLCVFVFKVSCKISRMYLYLMPNVPGIGSGFTITTARLKPLLQCISLFTACWARISILSLYS